MSEFRTAPGGKIHPVAPYENSAVFRHFTKENFLFRQEILHRLDASGADVPIIMQYIIIIQIEPPVKHFFSNFSKKL